jgi:hypothetical protein
MNLSNTAPARTVRLATECAAHNLEGPRLGLELPRQMSYQKWLNVGRQLASAASSSAWCLGDWLVFGQRRFDGRYQWAIEQTSLDYKTLRNYAWVARKFSLARRHGNLSFGHHAEVAGLSEPEQDFWLRKADALGWSRNALRREVNASLLERGQQAAGPEDLADVCGDDLALTEKLRVTVTSDQLDVIRRAARLAKLSVATWVPLVLEQAARTALGTGRDCE